MTQHSGTLLVGSNWVICTCQIQHGSKSWEVKSTGCRIHDAEADDADGDKSWEYECLVLSNGEFTVQCLAANSTSHAFEEASYEFEGICVAARRGDFLSD